MLSILPSGFGSRASIRLRFVNNKPQNLPERSCCRRKSSNHVLTRSVRAAMEESNRSAQEPVREVALWRKMGQNFNSAGIVLFAQILLGRQALAMPHVSVPDIRWVEWKALRDAGFVGCVFDKDNTLTMPYVESIHPPLAPALQECMECFEGRVVLYSNSAGLRQYDPEGAEAAALERALGVPVLRHADKKPAGGPADLEAHFGCRAGRLVFVGDRFLTDIVFGNRNGMLTVHVDPLPGSGPKEPISVRLARRIEGNFVATCNRLKVKAPHHELMPTPAAMYSFIKDPKCW